MEFVEAYVTQRGLAGADGSVGLPIIICGDFNGTREGKVAQFLESQGFRSAYDSVGGVTCTADAASWVSHKHRDGSCVGVDFMWVLNPSLQVRAPVPVPVPVHQCTPWAQCTSKTRQALSPSSRRYGARSPWG